MNGVTGLLLLFCVQFSECIDEIPKLWYNG